MCAEPGSGASCHPCLYSVMLYFTSDHTCDKFVENKCIEKTKWHIQGTLVNVQRGNYTPSDGSEVFLKAKR